MAQLAIRWQDQGKREVTGEECGMSDIPNRPRDFFFPDTWRVSVPELWDWVERNAMRVERSIMFRGYDIWMPIQDEDWQPNVKADDFATLYWRDQGA
jgi:hypothetical protein